MKAKHYIALAKAIKDNTFKQYEADALLIQAPQFIFALCDILAADNPKFDKEKFMESVK